MRSPLLLLIPYLVFTACQNNTRPERSGPVSRTRVTQSSPIKRPPVTKPPKPTPMKHSGKPLTLKVKDVGIYSEFDSKVVIHIPRSIPVKDFSLGLRTDTKVLILYARKVPIKVYAVSTGTLPLASGTFTLSDKSDLGLQKSMGARRLTFTQKGKTVILAGHREGSTPPEERLSLENDRLIELYDHITKGATLTIFSGRQKDDRDNDGIPNQVDILIGAIKLSWNAALYDDAYFSMKYPMGDPPKNKGVCTDVTIRAMRNAGFDLQELIHKDIRRNRSRYKAIKSVDRAVDHRRVRNMLPYFKAHYKLINTRLDWNTRSTYLPGDIIFMDVTSIWPGADHVGVIADKSDDMGFPYQIHNLSTTGYDVVHLRYRLLHHFRVTP